MIPVEISSSIITYYGRKVILNITRDITIRKKAEEELNKYRFHLEKMVKNRTKEPEEKTVSLKNLIHYLLVGN